MLKTKKQILIEIKTMDSKCVWFIGCFDEEFGKFGEYSERYVALEEVLKMGGIYSWVSEYLQGEDSIENYKYYYTKTDVQHICKSYNHKKMPKEISEDKITKDIPDGVYLVLPSRKKEEEKEEREDRDEREWIPRPIKKRDDDYER